MTIGEKYLLITPMKNHGDKIYKHFLTPNTYAELVMNLDEYLE